MAEHQLDGSFLVVNLHIVTVWSAFQQDPVHDFEILLSEDSSLKTPSSVE